MKSIKCKAEQMEATKAHLIITPCHNCHSGIEDIIGYYKLGMHVKFINELLVKAIDLEA
jgi:Fe-S oxidoreductase